MADKLERMTQLASIAQAFGDDETELKRAEIAARNTQAQAVQQQAMMGLMESLARTREREGLTPAQIGLLGSQTRAADWGVEAGRARLPGLLGLDEESRLASEQQRNLSERQLESQLKSQKQTTRKQRLENKQTRRDMKLYDADKATKLQNATYNEALRKLQGAKTAEEHARYVSELVAAGGVAQSLGGAQAALPQQQLIYGLLEQLLSGQGYTTEGAPAMPAAPSSGLPYLWQKQVNDSQTPQTSQTSQAPMTMQPAPMSTQQIPASNPAVAEYERQQELKALQARILELKPQP